MLNLMNYHCRSDFDISTAIYMEIILDDATFWFSLMEYNSHMLNTTAMRPSLKESSFQEE